MVPVDRKLLADFDWLLVVLALAVAASGLVVLCSAGFDPNAADADGSLSIWQVLNPTFRKQLLFLGCGLLVMTIGVLLPLQVIQKYSYFVYFLGLLALGGLFVVGMASHGARRWYSLGFISLQPAELMKLGVVLALARYLSRKPPARGFGFKELVVPFVLFLLPMALIIHQPDLGTALAVGAIGISMVLFLGVRPKPLLAVVLAGMLAVPVGWSVLKPYQKRRIMTLFDPESDPLGSGYHIIQSKIAVGSGGLLGKGFLRGTQSQLEYLPEHTTDFVFSVLAEEWGFAGCTAVLALYLCLLYRVVKIAGRAKHLYATLLTVGVGAWIFVHVFVNIGMVIGFLPVVGIPLPLFSYGGSSVLVMMLALGLVLGVGMRRRLHRV